MMPSTLAVRNALLVGLRVAPLPMSTAELADLAPWRAERFRCSEWAHRPTHTHARLIECDARVDVVELRQHGPDVYPHLRAMERKGLVERLSMPGDRRVYWRALPVAEVEHEIAELEAMWSA